MKAKTLLILLAAALSVFVQPAMAQISAKWVITTGPSDMASGALPTDFNSLTSQKIYTVSEAAGVGRMFCGIKLSFPAEASVVLSEVSWILRRNGSTAPWRSGGVHLWSTPTADSFPYLVAFNAAGTQMSSNNAASTGTTVPTTKDIFLGNHRWNLGGAHPKLTTSGQSYAEAFRIRGTYTIGSVTTTFAILPPNENVTATTEVIRGYAVVGVRMSAVDWVAQLKPGAITSVEGGLNHSLVDPSGMVGAVDGYHLKGLQWSTDLITWNSWNSISQDDNVVGDTATFTISIVPESPRLYFRGHSSDVEISGSTDWWPAESSSNN